MGDLPSGVHAAPDDDAAKLVVADALLEQRDPRGEFITLQFKAWRGEAGREDRARLATLLSKHRAQWLGELVDVLEPESLVFEKGFLRQAMLQTHACSSLERWLEAPALKEVRELALPEVEVAVVVAMAAHPRLRHLLGLRLASTKTLSTLATQRWPFGSIGLRGSARALAQALPTVGSGVAFEELQRLVLQLERFGRGAGTRRAQGRPAAAASRSCGVSFRVGRGRPVTGVGARAPSAPSG